MGVTEDRGALIPSVACVSLLRPIDGDDGVEDAAERRPHALLELRPLCSDGDGERDRLAAEVGGELPTVTPLP